MIFITGASSGLGAGLATHYDEQSQSTYLTGRSHDKLSALVENLKYNVGFQSCDLSSSQAVAQLFDELECHPKTIIHCAGSGYFGLLENQDPEEITKLIQNNLSSAINVVQEVVKRYKDHPINLVMIMSTAALQPKANESTYCAVKWAVKGFIESVRMELKGHAMKITAVYPGGMDTEFWSSSEVSIDTRGFMNAKDVASMIANTLPHIGNGYISDITINRL